MKTIKVLILTFALAVTGLAYATASTQSSPDEHKIVKANAACCAAGSMSNKACCKEGESCAKAECCKAGAECCKEGAECCKAGVSCCASADGRKMVEGKCCASGGDHAQMACCKADSKSDSACCGANGCKAKDGENKSR